jgi:DNA-binding CsgD family transcriptional regulator
MIRISGDLAWATFEQSVPAGIAEKSGLAGASRELRILERHDGAWKIAMTALVNRLRPIADGARFRVDGEGRVLWRNKAAEALIDEGCGLVVRGGKLAARDAAANRTLRSAMRWAAGQPGGYDVRRNALPIVIERRHEGGAEIWWVLAEAGIVQIIANPDEMSDDRLAAAAVVYGLSPAQAKLARAIVEGKALTVAAEAAGVTLNTARTHLRRMFDKTGVRTQAALVRSLLAIAPPE